MSHNDYWWVALENRLRKTHGDSFQNFFHDVMGAVHGDEYVAVRAQGRLGDGGVDGMLGSTIYQCYGAMNGSITNTRGACKKIRDDFAAAKRHKPEMTDWMFVHNHWDAIPEPLTAEMDTLKAAEGPDGVRIGHFGRHSFVKKMEAMSGSHRERIFGLAAQSEVDRERLPGEITALIRAVMAHIDRDLDLSQMPTKPVPQRKLDFNGIPIHWKIMLKEFFVHADVAKQCLDRYGDPTAKAGVATFLNQEYLSLRDEGTEPGEILHHLKIKLTGFVARAGDSSFDAAVLTVMAAMFEDCIIFEDEPKAETPEHANDPA